MKKILQKLCAPIFMEVMLIISANIILFYILLDIEPLKSLVHYLSQYEELKIGEIIVLFCALTFSLAIFAYRRRKEGLKLLDKMERLAITDPLTGLYNRRYLIVELEKETKRAIRTNEFFSLIMLDLDFFKKVNDKYGHKVGDQVLCQISSIFLNHCRETDIVTRWGGEEFIIFCPNTSTNGAVELGNKILDAVSNYNFDTIGHLTVSLGLTHFSKHDSSESIINRADSCLYKAKNTGRNKLAFSNLPRCYEFFDCKNKDCSVRKNNNTSCWNREENLCSNHFMGFNELKRLYSSADDCLQCEYYEYAHKQFEKCGVAL